MNYLVSKSNFLKEFCLTVGGISMNPIIKLEIREKKHKKVQTELFFSILRLSADVNEMYKMIS